MITVRDVTLRDGLQNLPVVLPTRAKCRLGNAILQAGIRELQVTSFVSYAKVPQLADAESLWEAFEGAPGIKDALVANLKGYERARAVGVARVEFVLAASRAYQARNANRTQEETFAELARIQSQADRDGVHLSVALANTWHCTYQGCMREQEIVSWLERLTGIGVEDICLADTTGHATASEIAGRIESLTRAFPATRFRAHLHVLPGRRDAVVKAEAAIAGGIHALDATLLDTGGSPFAGEVGVNLNVRALVEAGLFPLELERLAEAEALLQAYLHPRAPQEDPA